MSAASLAPIGLFGGTFDPIHYGHLRPALELREQLQLSEVRFIPSSVPPHRDEPSASPQQRLAMLRLALQGTEGLTIDDRELMRKGPSYMADTLRSLRDEVSDRPLVLLLGLDAFLGLTSWHEWHSIIELAHIAVAIRPGWDSASLHENKELDRLWQKHACKDAALIHHTPAGCMVMVDVTPLSISATAIRARLSHGLSPRFLLPDSVLDYIETNRLYVSP